MTEDNLINMPQDPATKMKQDIQNKSNEQRNNDAAAAPPPIADGVALTIKLTKGAIRVVANLQVIKSPGMAGLMLGVAAKAIVAQAQKNDPDNLQFEETIANVRDSFLETLADEMDQVTENNGQMPENAPEVTPPPDNTPVS